MPPDAPPANRSNCPRLSPADRSVASLRRLRLRNTTRQLGAEKTDIVNAALQLRRPLLVTGPPGIGKSTLAYLIGRELGLGRVLEWNIGSRTTLRDGLYVYDALERAPVIAACKAQPRQTSHPVWTLNDRCPWGSWSPSGPQAQFLCSPAVPGCCSPTNSTRATSTYPTTCCTS